MQQCVATFILLSVYFHDNDLKHCEINHFDNSHLDISMKNNATIAYIHFQLYNANFEVNQVLKIFNLVEVLSL